SEAILPTLLEAAKDPDAEVRKLTYGALAAIGPKAKPAVPALVDEMSMILKDGARDPGAAERFRRAGYALGQIGEISQAMPLFRQGLKSTDARLRGETVMALGLIGADARELIPELCAMLGDP